MSDFTLLEPIRELERFETDKGRFVVYEVGIDGEQGKAEAIRHKRKDSSPAPKAGEVVDGEIVSGKDGQELKRIWKPQGTGGGSNNSSGGKSGTDYRTPQQIMRSDALGKAMHWCDIKVAAGEWQKLTWEQYIAMVDAFYEDIKAAS